MPNDVKHAQDAVAKAEAALTEAKRQLEFTATLADVEKNPDDLATLKAAAVSAERAGDATTAQRLKARWAEALMRRQRA
jgi:hypothetical protein